MFSFISVFSPSLQIRPINCVYLKHWFLLFSSTSMVSLFLAIVVFAVPSLLFDAISGGKASAVMLQDGSAPVSPVKDASEEFPTTLFSLDLSLLTIHGILLL